MIEYKPLTANELADVKAMIGDARAAMNASVTDFEQMKAIKLALLKGHRGYALALHMAAFLAVITNDLRAWHYVDNALVTAGDPALGWLIFHKGMQVLGSDFDQAAWFHLIENSARKGFLPARMRIAREHGPKLPIIRQLYLLACGVRVTATLLLITVRDPKDRRLPLSTRRVE